MLSSSGKVIKHKPHSAREEEEIRKEGYGIVDVGMFGFTGALWPAYVFYVCYMLAFTTSFGAIIYIYIYWF